MCSEKESVVKLNKDVNKLLEMNFGVFGVSDWSNPELNCAEKYMKIAKAFTRLFLPQIATVIFKITES